MSFPPHTFPDNPHILQCQREDVRTLVSNHWTPSDKMALSSGVLEEGRRTLTEHRMDTLKETNDPELIAQIFEEFKQIRKLPAEHYTADQIDWNRLVQRYLPKRSVTEATIQWTMHQHPEINNQPWTEEETSELLKAINNHGVGEWQQIAGSLSSGRNAQHCFKRWLEITPKTTSDHDWTAEDDAKLMRLYNMYGENYTEIAVHFKQRSAKQTRDRICACLRKATRKKGRWSKEEDELLQSIVGFYLAEAVIPWCEVASLLDGRCDKQCRDRWVKLLHYGSEPPPSSEFIPLLGY